MNIVFKNLHIESFMSIGYADIDFDKKGYTLVEGINNCAEDSATSNGSGKSSIWEALVWCLTGETIRGTNDVENMFFDGGTLVLCQFKVDGCNYIIKREQNIRGVKTSLKFFVDGVEVSGKGVRDTKEIIKQYLPDFDSLLLGSVIVLGQGLPARFTANTPSGRKEILEKLTKSDFMIEDLKNRISNRAVQLKDKESELSFSIMSDSATITANENLVSRLSEQLKSEYLDELERKIQSCSMDIHFLNINLSELKSKSTLLSAQLSQIEQEIEKEDKVQKVSYDEVKAKFDAELESARAAYYDLKSKADCKLSEIEKAESVREFCPTCGQRLPDVHKINTSSMRAEYEDLTKKCDSAKSSLEEIKEKMVAAIDEWDKNRSKKIDDLYARKNETKASLQEVENRILNDTKSVNESTAEMSSCKAALNSALETNSEISRQIESLEKETLEAEKRRENSRKEFDGVVQSQEIVSKFQTAITRDFRGFLLTNIISFINDRCTDLSGVMFDNGKISVEQDKNNISVKLNGKEYEMLSGGERQKVDIIIQFAIRDMLCKYTGFSSSIIVLDEIFDNLDRQGCSRVVDLINRDLSDLDSIFIISHHADELQLPVDNIIRVVKSKDKVSTVEQR